MDQPIQPPEFSFHDFHFDTSLEEGIDALGYSTPTPVQFQSIPILLEGHDLIASAQTGTGKTAAFLLPVIQKIIARPSPGKIRALIIVPTRELAIQIDRIMEGLSYFTPVSSIAVYGGSDGNAFAREQIALTQGADMVICTPGRLIAHLMMGYVKFDGLEFLVLDEADRMLDMGFYEDIMGIIDQLPSERQTMLFSATMPHKIKVLTKKIQRHPKEVSIMMSKPAEKVLQVAYVVYENQKVPLLKHLIHSKELRSILIFCSTKQMTKDLAAALKRAGLQVDEIHSDLEQSQREIVFRKFKNKLTPVLVATDVMARGIDIEDIDLIVNYDVPHDGESYIHRIGRTARAQSDGVAITLINEKDQAKFAAIEELLQKTVHKAVVPENFGQTPAYEPMKKGRGGDNRGRKGTGGKGRAGDRGRKGEGGRAR
ncbi:MAG: DEAD/DEAH box helicase [Bacteroidota bacterium]